MSRRGREVTAIVLADALFEAGEETADVVARGGYVYVRHEGQATYPLSEDQATQYIRWLKEGHRGTYETIAKSLGIEETVGDASYELRMLGLVRAISMPEDLRAYLLSKLVEED